MRSIEPGISRFRVHACACPGMNRRTMLELQGNKKERPAVSADFQTALTQQVLRTELIRIKALIGTMVLLAVLVLIIDTLYPYAVEHLWHGRLRPIHLYAILAPFILFELWIHR